jgi:Flp pilus assembly protein TadG
MRRIYARLACVARSHWRNLRNNETGTVVAFLVAIPVLAGTLAIGLETGQLYRVKRQMQGAADAAALAGSIDRIAAKANDVVTATARYEAQRNGFTNGQNGVVVTVNGPPTSGANIAPTGAVEVIITKATNFSFGNVINNWMGKSTAGFTMRVRSVAAQGSYSTSTSSAEGCMLALTTAAEQGLSFTSFNNFHSDCTLISNGSSTSNDSSASVYLANFNNATLKSVWTRGSFFKASYNGVSLTDAAKVNQTTAVVDPYATLANPAPGTCTYNPFSAPGGASITLSPGTYCGGLTVSSYNNVYFNPGTYYIANGDLRITSDNNVNCNGCTGGAGVTFVMTQTTGNNNDIGGVVISSQNTVQLSAPNSGSFAGVLFYQDRRAAVGTMTSATKIFQLTSLNVATLIGAIYFPNNRIDVSSINNTGLNSSSGCTVWIGRYIKFSSYNNNYVGNCGTFGTTPATIVTTTTTSKGRLFE